MIKTGAMIRALSLSAMTGTFLMISPKLRESVAGGYNQAGLTLEQNSPYSYIILGVVVIIGLMILVSRSAQPR